MNPQDNTEKLIRELVLPGTKAADERILNDALAAFEKSKVVKSAEHQPNVWRIIMKSPITKLAAAAVIIIAIVVGIHQFGGSIDGASVAWAEVAEKVNQIQTYIHRTTQTCVGMEGFIESMVYNSSEYGRKVDVYKNGETLMRTYVLPEEKVAIAIMPAGKKYQRTSLTEEQLQQELYDGDPREIVKQFMSMEYKKLGRDKIDYLEVEGIEVKNPKIMEGMFISATGRLWVDIKTDLPVRIEIEGVANRGLGQMEIVVDKLQWNVKLEASFFEPNIPADYTLVEK